jgi:murein DD-endopeptidase MepM/ murein hydrolase activator NlpD
MKRILLFSLAVLWAAVATVGNACAQAAGPVYIVQSGDYLSTIAERFGIGLTALMDANGLDTSSVIQPGNRLVIPGLDGITGVLTTKPVQLGETLDVLALRHAMAKASLLRLNHIVNPERVFAGESLVVTEPEQGNPAPAPWAHGHAVSLGTGMPLIALAAAEGRNPWEVLVQNELSSAADMVPGQTVLLASVAGETPLRAWPDPIRDISFRQFPLVQGSTSEITLKMEGASAADGMLGSSQFHFSPLGEGWVALQGIDIQAAAQPVMFQAHAKLADGREVAFQQDVSIVPGDYHYALEKDTVPPETIKQDAINAENAAMADIVKPVTADRLWTGAFTPPSSLGISAAFGAPRLFNGTLSTVHHGVDYYGLIGTPIVAPAAGKIVFTGPQVICGNATVIDHGWGVYSRFCHQSKFEVSVGDVVAQGQEIGKVGKTGRSTGPHLHWEIWVGGVNADPLAWVQTAYP